MASPQVENGYIRVANELLDALCKIHLSGNEWSYVHALIRKTYGFNKKEDWITNTQIALLTGLHKVRVSEAKQSLIAKGIVTENRNSISLVKDYEKWTHFAEKANKVTENRNSELRKTVPTKDTITKDNRNTVATATPNKKQSMKKNKLGGYREDSHGDYEEVIDFESQEEIVEPEKEKKGYDPEVSRLAYVNSAHKHQQILAWFYSKKNIWETFKSRGNLAGADYRHVPSAKRLVKHEWTREDMLNAYNKMMKNETIKDEWTLDTLEKYLTK